MVARASLHMWEEPCISGERGSGTVFFSGCPLGCVYCQNREISRGQYGKMLSPGELSEVFMRLSDLGAHNINLVTPTHYSKEIKEALNLAKEKGLNIPVVYNCSGYELCETLRDLEGLVDIYLTDFKYMDRKTAKKYSGAEDYPEVAAAALDEMMRQCPEPLFDDEGMMKRGVIVRHLLLPGQLQNAKDVVRYVYGTFGDNAILSLMSQYTPVGDMSGYPELERKVTAEEYDALVDYAWGLGVENAFIQEGEAASESFIPPFDLEGLEGF